MTPASPYSSTLAIDGQGLEALRLKAKSNPGGSAAAASKQFEALFLGMMLKGMRAASPQDGPFDNEQTRLYTSLLDQQLAQHMAKRGTGLAEVMARQLEAKFTDTSKTDNLLPEMPDVFAAPAQALTPSSALPSALPSTLPAALPAVSAAATSRVPVPVAGAPSKAQPQDFISRVWPHAVDAAQSIGVQPRFVVGQAALESGWGKYEIRNADGQPSHNLFGIKAGGNWKGQSVEKTTTEYVNGAAVTITDKFRVYSSYSESFRDYANLLRDNARYAGVLGQGDAKGFAHGLQRAGYATDPAYADKLVSVINSTRDPVALVAADTPVAVAAAARGASGAADSGHPIAGESRQVPYRRDPATAGGLVRAAYGLKEAAGIDTRRAVYTPPVAPAVASPPAVRVAAPASSVAPNRQAEEFVNRVWVHAVDAAQALGVQPQFIVGHAALVTGWGRHEIRTADGRLSHNLFGIKAGADWKGATVDKTSTIEVNGVATKVVNKYRVYSSYGEGLRDHANLLRDNGRYSGAIGQGSARGYAQGLQRGGYATDPAYADKLVSVINSPSIRQIVEAERRPQVVAQR